MPSASCTDTLLVSLTCRTASCARVSVLNGCAAEPSPSPEPCTETWMTTGMGAGLLGIAIGPLGRCEPAPSGGATTGIGGNDPRCWAPLEDQTSEPSVRIRMVRMLMGPQSVDSGFSAAIARVRAGSDSQKALQSLLKMDGQGSFRRIRIAHRTGLEDLDVLPQSAHGQRLRREPIEPDQREIILQAPRGGFDERVAQVVDQRAVEPVLERVQDILFLRAELAFLQALQQRNVVRYEALDFRCVALFRQRARAGSFDQGPELVGRAGRREGRPGEA